MPSNNKYGCARMIFYNFFLLTNRFFINVAVFLFNNYFRGINLSKTKKLKLVLERKGELI